MQVKEAQNSMNSKKVKSNRNSLFAVEKTEQVLLERRKRGVRCAVCKKRKYPMRSWYESGVLKYVCQSCSSLTCSEREGG